MEMYDKDRYIYELIGQIKEIRDENKKLDNIVILLLIQVYKLRLSIETYEIKQKKLDYDNNFLKNQVKFNVK